MTISPVFRPMPTWMAPFSGTETFAKRRDDAFLDGDIANRCIGGGDHRAVADHQVKVAHALSFHIVLQRLFYQRLVKRYCGALKHRAKGWL